LAKEVEMQKSICGLLVLAALLGALFAPGETKAATDVQVNINIGPPPVYVVPAPPPVVVIPRTYVYVVPDIEVNILFFHGYWFRPHEGHWFRARSYNGPWTYLPPKKVPRVLVELPPHYRNVPPGYSHIPYGQVKKNWGKWERERHWDKDKQWREGWQGKPEGHGKPEEKGKPESRGKPEGKGGEERGKGHGGQDRRKD
jgi:hypothetical protein